MSGERVGFRFKHADAVVKRNPQGRSRRGWVIEPVEQTTSRGTKMPAYKIRWRDSERPETVLQHMLIADPDPSPFLFADSATGNPSETSSLDYRDRSAADCSLWLCCSQRRRNVFPARKRSFLRRGDAGRVSLLLI